MNPQLAGVEDLTGTYPFDIGTSVRTFKLNMLDALAPGCWDAR